VNATWIVGIVSMLPRTASVAPALDPNGYTVAPIPVVRLLYSSTLTSVF